MPMTSQGQGTGWFGPNEAQSRHLIGRLQLHFKSVHKRVDPNLNVKQSATECTNQCDIGIQTFIDACAFYLIIFQVEINSRTPIPLFRTGSVHSGSASQDDCGLVLPDELRVSSIPCQVPTLCLNSVSAQTDFVVSKMCTSLNVTCHLHFLKNQRGLQCATAVTRGGTDTE